MVIRPYESSVRFGQSVEVDSVLEAADPGPDQAGYSTVVSVDRFEKSFESGSSETRLAQGELVEQTSAGLMTDYSGLATFVARWVPLELIEPADVHPL